jgi:hypothetical protein
MKGRTLHFTLNPKDFTRKIQKLKPRRDKNLTSLQTRTHTVQLCPYQKISFYTRPHVCISKDIILYMATRVHIVRYYFIYGHTCKSSDRTDVQRHSKTRSHARQATVRPSCCYFLEFYQPSERKRTHGLAPIFTKHLFLQQLSPIGLADRSVPIRKYV